MTDFKFFKQPQKITLEKIIEVTGAKLLSDASTSSAFSGVGSLDIAESNEVSFLENKKFIKSLENTKAGACFVGENLADEVAKFTLPLIVDNPHVAYVKIARLMYPDYAGVGNCNGKGRVHPSAVIDDSAQIGNGVIIKANAVIGKNVVIGDNCIIEPNAVIEDNVVIGANCTIGACALVSYALIGDNCMIYSGTRIGTDGFGFIMSGQGHTKIPQLGRVIIGNSVEIGANSTVDRGASGDTVIEDGTKFDNMCHIAHNVVIGKHCIMAGQVGISGSVTIGNFVVAGGKVGFVDHVTVGDGVQIAARSGITKNIESGAVVSGMPPFPIKEKMRQIAAVKKLANGEYVKKSDLNTIKDKKL